MMGLRGLELMSAHGASVRSMPRLRTRRPRSAALLLRHFGATDEELAIKNAVLTTLEQGVVTRDIKREGHATTEIFP